MEPMKLLPTFCLFSMLTLTMSVYAATQHSSPAPSLMAKEAEIIQVGVRIGQMWAGEKAFLNGLALLEKRGHALEELMDMPEFGEHWKTLVRQNTEEMKRIESKWGWPSLSVFGPETSMQAYWIVQHTDQDIAFQEKSLLLAAKNLETKDTDLSSFASLWDHVQVGKHQLQRYGTEGDCRGKGLWEPAPMEDPAHVNVRRHLMGLDPIESDNSKKNTGCYSMNQ